MPHNEGPYMKARYAFFFTGLIVALFFSFFEAATDYADLKSLNLSNWDEYSFLNLLTHNVYNWASWFIASLILMNVVPVPISLEIIGLPYIAPSSSDMPNASERK